MGDKQPWNLWGSAGTWYYNGQAVQILQQGGSLTFINQNGQGSSGLFLSSTQVEATGWGNLVGTLTTQGGQTIIEWANGTTWTMA
jgi:hypothetical protein